MRRELCLQLVSSAAALFAFAPAAKASAPSLSFPLACTIGRSCEVQHYLDRDPGPGALDYRCGHRTYQGHNGIDIRLATMAAQRAGVDVLAAAAGRVSRLRDSVADISIRAPGAPSVAGQECGNGVVIDHGDGWETQYCHLAKGSVRVKVGDAVTAGQAIARVGLSGDTEFPHLHLTLRHGTTVVDPFAPDTGGAPLCAAQSPLWDAPARAQLTYKAGVILNSGWASSQVTAAEIEDGAVRTPGAASALLVPYVRLIGLAAGDEVEIVLLGPGGAVLAQARTPLDRDKDVWLGFVGRKRPTGGWPGGTYIARFKVYRAGHVAISQQIELRI